METSEATGELLLLVVLVALAGFFAGSEVGFLGVQRVRARQAAEAGSRLAKILRALQERRSVVLATMLVGITGSYYIGEHVATVLGIEFFGPTVGPIVALVGMTIVVLVFAEATPMQFAARNPERVALYTAPVIAIMTLVLYPVVGLLALIVRGLLFVVGVRSTTVLPTVTQDHLRAMIEEGQSQGTLAAGTGRMLHGALDFGGQTVGQVMTPRPDMICVQEKATIAETLLLALENKHSRLPTYGDDRDDITGVVYVKDLLPYVRLGEMSTPVARVARATSFVPESLQVDMLLRRLQADRRTMAIATDEYGGTAGLVTMEDLLEEIVGEIEDEYDVEQLEIVRTEDGALICDASIAPHMLEHLVHAELPAEDFDSLGGVILEAEGRIPAEGESFRWGQLQLTVEVMDGVRISCVRVTELPAAEDDGDEEGGRG